MQKSAREKFRPVYRFRSRIHARKYWHRFSRLLNKFLQHIDKKILLRESFPPRPRQIFVHQPLCTYSQSHQPEGRYHDRGSFLTWSMIAIDLIDEWSTLQTSMLDDRQNLVIDHRSSMWRKKGPWRAKEYLCPSNRVFMWNIRRFQNTSWNKLFNKTCSKKYACKFTIDNGCGYGCKKIFRTDTDNVFIIFMDTVSVDGCLYLSDPGYVTLELIRNVPHLSCLILFFVRCLEFFCSPLSSSYSRKWTNSHLGIGRHTGCGVRIIWFRERFTFGLRSWKYIAA